MKPPEHVAGATPPAPEAEVPHAADLALVSAAVQGDVASVDELARRLRCVGRILRVRSRALCGGLPEVELQDLAQDVLVKVLAKLGRYAGRAALESWVFSFCEGELRNALRKRRTRPVPLVLEADAPLAAPEEDRERFEDLLACLEKLEPTDRQVVQWKHEGGLQLAEIAARARANLNTVKSRYYRALQQLRGCLEGSARRTSS
jgi:RNA polymerase sigma-70 factor (ECF subfamily)